MSSSDVESESEETVADQKTEMEQSKEEGQVEGGTDLNDKPDDTSSEPAVEPDADAAASRTAGENLWLLSLNIRSKHPANQPAPSCFGRGPHPSKLTSYFSQEADTGGSMHQVSYAKYDQEGECAGFE
jgi:hypothetical protein